MTTTLETASQKGRNLLELLLADKHIVTDPYSVPDNPPYFHEANGYGSTIIICNPTDDHFNHFDTSDWVSVDVTNWCNMEDGLAPYIVEKYIKKKTCYFFRNNKFLFY